MDENKLWTKDFICLIIVNFCMSLIFYIFMITLFQYITQTYNASSSTAGLIIGIFICGSLITRLLTGKYFDILGRKRVTRISIFCYLILTAAYFFTYDIYILFVVRLLHGLAFGVVNTAINTNGQSMIPSARRGEGTGFLSLGQVFAAAVGPFMGIFLINNYSYNYVILLCTLSCALSFFLSLVIKIENIEVPAEVIEKIKKSFRFSDFIEMHALPLSTVMIVSGLCYTGYASFLNSYTAQINLSEYASLFFIFYAIALGISRPLGGILLDRKSDNIVMYSFLACMAIGLIFMANAHSATMLILAAVFLAMGFGTPLSCSCAIVVRLCPRQKMSMAISTFYICLDAGTAIGPYFLGLIIPFLGFRGMYFVLAGIAALSVVQYYFVHGRKVKYLYKKPDQSDGELQKSS